MTEELWKTIPTFPRYDASNLGRVRNNRTMYIMKQRTNPKGYKEVFLHGDDKKTHTMGVHRAVALAWIPNNNLGLTVNHIDKNKANNTLENLEWMDNADNVRYSQGKKIRCKETGVVYSSIWEASRETGFSCRTLRASIYNRYERPKRIRYTFEEVG